MHKKTAPHSAPQTIHAAPQSVQAVPQAVPLTIPLTVPQTVPHNVQAVSLTAPHNVQAIPLTTPQNVQAVSLTAQVVTHNIQAVPHIIPTLPQTLPQPIPLTAQQKLLETKKAKGLNIAAAIVSTVTAIVLVVGVSTNYWIVSKRDNQTYGLWRYCDHRDHVARSDIYMYHSHGGPGPSWSGVRNTITKQQRCRFTIGGGIMIGGLILYGIGVILTIIIAIPGITRKRNLIIATIVVYCVALVTMIAVLGTAGSLGDRFVPHEVIEEYNSRRTVRIHTKWISLSWSFDVAAVAPFGVLITLVLYGMSCSEYSNRSGDPSTDPSADPSTGSTSTAIPDPMNNRRPESGIIAGVVLIPEPRNNPTTESGAASGVVLSAPANGPKVVTVSISIAKTDIESAL